MKLEDFWAGVQPGTLFGLHLHHGVPRSADGEQNDNSSPQQTQKELNMYLRLTVKDSPVSVDLPRIQPVS